eukprot:Em0016g797a
MVFESVLVQVLNRFLGAYVENLDSSQLKANVWSGDVKLGGLRLKQNALDKLDLPFRIFAGYLDNFSMKVPWSNLYTDPVIADISGVYIVAGPATAVRYDAETDLREQREAKEKQLKQVDETKKRAEIKEDKPEEAPGYLEKLVTQIVKNLKVKVKNIHIQYEDSVSNPSSPFSFGVSLDSLTMENTDSAYDSEGTLVNPDTSLIYKEVLYQNIARTNRTPDMQYVIKPISASARVRLSTKPGQDMHIPQALVKLVLQDVALSLSKQQVMTIVNALVDLARDNRYQDIMNFIESLDRLAISQRFRKYRPLKSLEEDKRAWWRYAFHAEMEDIKRRTQAWSWTHIKAHRGTCREYTKAYQEKLLAKSVSLELTKRIQGLEDQLDVLNITICRQLAENEAQRRLQEKKKVESEKVGWLAWVWGTTAAPAATDTAKGSPKESAIISDEDIAREKEKLYQAIGYSKDSKLPDYPKEYVAHNLVFELKRMSVQIRNENGNIGQFVVMGIAADLKHRPASKNLSVSTVVKTVYMSGLSQSGKGKPPSIIEVQEELGNYGGSRVKSRSLMHVDFEMNPLNSQVNYRVAASLSPILAFYDAATVDAMIGMFLLPRDVQLQSISAAAASALEGIKTQTRAGLEHIIGERTFFELDVSLKSPCLLIPEGGAMESSATVVVADLGSLRVTTDLTRKVIPDVRTASLEELQEASYDNFNIQISNVQLIVTGSGEDWRKALLSCDITHHLLKPSGLDLVVKKSILPMDTRLPSLLVTGTLPSIALSLSDKKVKQLMKEKKTVSVYPTIRTASVISMLARDPDDSEQEQDEDESEFETASEGDDESEKDDQGKDRAKTCKQTDDGAVARAAKDGGSTNTVEASATTLKILFTINGIAVNYSEYVDGGDIERLKFLLSEMETEVVIKSWDLNVTASIGSAEIQDYFNKSTEPHLLLNSGSNGKKCLNVKYSKNDRQSLHYCSNPQPTEHFVSADMSVVKVEVLKGSLVKLMSMALSIMADITSDDQPSKDIVYYIIGKGGGRRTQQTLLVRWMIQQKLYQHRSKFSRIWQNSSADIGRAYLYVSATVQRLMGVVVFKFINRVMHEIQRAKDDENGSKIGLSVSISAPLVVLPLTSTSSSAFVADLGQVEVTNTFLLAEKVAVGQHPSEKFISSGGVPAIVDDMTVDITSVQLFKTSTAMMLKTEDRSHMIIKPIKFHGHVIRKLSGWCSVVPDISIDADLPSLEVQLSPGDYSAILSLMNSLSDGRSTTPSSDKETSDGEGEGDEGQVEAENGEIAIPPTSKDYVKLCMKFQMKEVILHLNEQSDGGHIERLRFLLKIQDYFTKSVEENSQPLLSSGSKERKFLTATYCKNDRQSPHDDASSPPTEQSVDADMSVVKIHLLKRSLVKLMSMGLSIMAEIKSSDQPSYSSVAEEVVRQHLPGERLVYVEARFGGLEVTLGDELGYILSADMTDFSTTITVLEEQTLVATSMKNIMITDKDPNSCHPKVVRKIDDSTVVLSAQVKVFKIAEKTNVDINSSDVFVSAIVQRLAVLVVFKFVNRVMHYVDEVMEELKLAKKVLGLSEKSPLKELGVQGAQEEKNGTKIGLSVSISAPLVVLPLTSTSSSAFVADLGQMEVTNTFLLAEKVAVGQHPSEKFISSGGVPAIVDDMTVDITSVQLFQIKDVKGFKIDELGQAITEPIQFHGHVIRKLSDWCSVIPDISIDAELPSLEVQLGPGDYSAILSLMNSLSDGRSTTPSSDKKEGEDDGEKGEIVEEIKQLEVPSDMKGVGASSNVKFLVKFQMKKNNPQSPHYGSSLQPTEQFVKVDMSVMKVQLQQGPLIKLMSMALSIMAEIKPKDQPSSATKDVVTLPKEGAAEKKAVRSGLPGERQVYIEARFGGLEVTLGDEHGDILSADMTGKLILGPCTSSLLMLRSPIPHGVQNRHIFS